MSLCGCKNHLGLVKQGFATKDSALKALVRKHLWTGKTYRVYACPLAPRFHITSAEERSE